MVAPDVWLDAALAEQSATEQIVSEQTGSVVSVPTDTGATAPEEILVTESQTGTIVSESSGSIISESSGAIVSDSSDIIESIGSGELVSTGTVDPVADPITKSDTENAQEDMVLKIDGDIEVNTGIVLEDANKRITIEIESGTTINTVDADGKDIEGSTGQVMVDTSLDQSQRSDIETDTVI
jgi:hypothetical protein